jgi:hypothetical protein
MEMSYRGFMLWPGGQIEEVDEDGAMYVYPPEPGLYGDLLLAGYPLHKDDLIARWDGIIDLRGEDGRVIVHCPRGECDMGPAAELFLSWFRANA